MDEIIKAYQIFKNPLEGKEKVRFIFTDMEKYQIMFQTILENKESFASVNLKSLDKHLNYSYRYQIHDGEKWNNIKPSKNIFAEYYSETFKLKYSFYKYYSSKKLYIIFSSSTVSQTYNYVKTLRPLKENKLFLIDENMDGEKSKCSYYMGYNMSKDYEKKIIGLIRQVIQENNLKYEDVVLFGSSKGGFAALYYAFKYGFGNAIVGSPTIFLGENHKTSKFGKKIIQHLTGGYSTENIEWLDKLIMDNVENSLIVLIFIIM